MDAQYLPAFIMYAVFMFSIVAYATLDGFDIGVGCLHLFAKDDVERRVMINAIGPVWDGNSTWIVIGGGTLFAAFPKAFATLAPNVYTPFMMMLFGFMLRAASIEFRGKAEAQWWKTFWDISFSVASILLGFLVGILLGNLIGGVPLNDQGIIEGGLKGLLRPYPLLIAFFGLSCFMMHGSIYLLMKTDNLFHHEIRRWAHRSISAFLVLWFLSTLATFLYNPHMIDPFRNHPYFILLPIISFVSILMILRMVTRKKDGLAFFYSCLAIFSLMCLFVVGVFPNIVYSTINPEQNSLTLLNSCVSTKALWILVAVACTGVPLSFFYFPYIFRVFRGKVKIDSLSY